MTDKKTDKKDELKSTEYDGIQEYDNDLPRWWVGTFVISVLFGFGYWFYYYTFEGPNQKEKYQEAFQVYEKRYQSKDIEVSDEALLAMMNSAEDLAKGKEIYDVNCVACHLASGGGSIGPNLTDAYWIHGGSPSDIHRIVVEGVVEKGMLAWKGILTSTQIDQVTAYVLTLKNTNVAGGKEPQGEPVE